MMIISSSNLKLLLQILHVLNLKILVNGSIEKLVDFIKSSPLIKTSLYYSIISK